MEKLIIAAILAFTVIGGSVALSTTSSTPMTGHAFLTCARDL